MRFTLPLLILTLVAVVGCNSKSQSCPNGSCGNQCGKKTDPSEKAATPNVSTQKTGRELDVMIQGEGFLQVLDEATGKVFYTRFGQFHINPERNLIIKSASTERLIEPTIMIPENTAEIIIRTDGTVAVKQADSSETTEVGQIQLGAFENPDSLRKVEENIYAETDASGVVSQDSPGQEGMGTLIQGSLEKSRWTR